MARRYKAEKLARKVQSEPEPFVPKQRPPAFSLQLQPNETKYTLKEENLSIGHAKKLVILLQENPDVTELCLYKIGPNLSTILLGPISITHLDLSTTDLSSQPNQSVALLFLRGTLTHLNLNNTCIPAQYVASFLYRNSMLQNLKLVGNKIDNFDLSTILFHGLNTCTSLCTMDLSHNDISSSGISDLITALESLPTLTNLTIQEPQRQKTKPDHRGDLYTKITPNLISGSIVAKLIEVPTLVSLDISHSQVDQQSLVGEALEDNPKLQHFYFKDPDQSFFPFIPSVVHHNDTLKTFHVQSKNWYKSDGTPSHTTPASRGRSPKARIFFLVLTLHFRILGA